MLDFKLETDDGDSSDRNEVVPSGEWQHVDGSTLLCFPFNCSNLGFTINNPSVNEESTPLDFYKLFVSDNIIDNIVKFTNMYVEQQIISSIASEEDIPPNSFMAQWHETNSDEIWTFLALVLWMGLDRKPRIRDYWSGSLLYRNKSIITLSKMSRTRFQSILTFLHFSDNTEMQNNDRLYKLTNLIVPLITNFQKYVVPSKKVCIDETMIPFRGKIFFRQYIKGKRHKYGIKMYKLCLEKGYTYNFSIYVGKSDSQKGNVTTNLVLSLMEPLLNTGRTLYVDNFFTSVTLAEYLLQNQTYLVGTLRANRKCNPKEVVQIKLKKGEMSMLERNGIIVGKWRDKRNVLFLTTESQPDYSYTNPMHNAQNSPKPTTILSYNTAKSFIDISDQMAAYASALRRTLKWYHKVGLELLTNTAIVNAYLYYKHVTSNKITITQFRESIVSSLLMCNPDSDNIEETGKHALVTETKSNRCTNCYKENSKRLGRSSAITSTKRVKTKCIICKKTFCIPCFFKTHHFVLKSSTVL